MFFRQMKRYHLFMSDDSIESLAPTDVLTRARKIKLLMDVDGTLTEGGVCLISTTATEGAGEPVVSEMKVFSAHDGKDCRSPTRWVFRQASSLDDLRQP
jgi:hypothetical protein